MMSSAKYGYVITSTPGLISEGRFPLSAKGIAANQVERGFWSGSDCNEPIAVFETIAAAEAAIASLVPAGSTPATYAGLSVEPTFDKCVTEVVHGVGLVGMSGFVVPTYE